ncbi:tigger transposable element-derived protein 6-like [Sphaeramia orbicularis]|uniref:tigger transposable element-derived protein 6-like n=1 Tax=Sphaeramia orbicularis TaxID=375764 RepID=UPI00117C45C6|nr:tigger transposable element-derived protein 6-like [Sphaeramia orbicularis]
MKRRTVGDILAQKEKWLESTDDNPFRRNRQAKNKGMEKALFLWFSGARAQNLPVTDDILRAKGKELGEKLGVTDFAYSSGWLTRFKKRFAISNRVISGESAGIDPEMIDEGRRKAKTVIAKYKPEDVFNMDETGLYYRMLPDRTLTLATSTKGIKKAKIRISLALTANATGTEKLTPLVIGHVQRPRCFKHFNPGVYAQYFHNKKTWMTSVIFNEWITELDQKMRRQNRHILLLLDNATSHIVPVDDDGQPKLTNVDVHFLPPTTTSHLQPMDAGIIKAFKAHYRRFQVRHMIDAYDAGRPTEIQLNHAIRYVKQAWNAITEKTIVNCWEHVKIFPDRTPAADADVEVLDPVPAPLQNDFGNMFERMAEMYNIPPEHVMSESEFISVDDGLSTGEELTEEEIINIVVGPSSDPGNEDEDADDIDIEPQRPPTSCEAKAALDVVVRFLESKTPADGVMKKVMDISSEINNLITKSTKQSAITDFFKSQ